MQTPLPPHMKMVQTQDGSPSMEISSEQASELMHHSHGAFSESIYIYAHALKTAQSFSQDLQVLSIGLGLAYNELISHSFALSEKINLSLLSFESEEFLRTQFLNWANNIYAAETLSSTYAQILDRCGSEFHVSPHAVREHLQAQLKNDRLILKSSFQLDELGDRPFNVVYFDPFSKKKSPEFWSEEFLNEFLKVACAPHCVFSTYAATGVLKRALSASGFRVDLRPGFSGKKHSIFATRGFTKV